MRNLRKVEIVIESDRVEAIRHVLLSVCEVVAAGDAVCVRIDIKEVR